MENPMDYADRAWPVRELLEREKYGVLSTLSRKAEGWPFGSLAPFALSKRGEPLVLFSNLAEHTQNLLWDARVSMFVQDSLALADPQAGARVTLLCTATVVAKPEIDEARQAYLQRFPTTIGLLQLGDFRFFKLQIEQARYIGGFGEMYWLSGVDMLTA
jgi:heme iron utilization protein